MARTAVTAARHARDDETDELFDALHRASSDAEADAVVERITILYLDLCSTMAARYDSRGVEHDDLVQIARLALVAAIRRYRPGRGPSFAAFAVPTISGELKRHFRDRCWLVRPPRRLQELRAAVCAQREQLEQVTGRAPSDTELARALSTSTAAVREASLAAQGFNPVPIDTAPGSTHRELVLAERLSCPDAAIEAAADRISLEEALRELEEPDRLLLEQRFVLGLTQREIGEQLGVSQMQVSRSLRRVLATLRELLGEPEQTAASA